jgi:tRNA G46 methylase TrmB
MNESRAISTNQDGLHEDLLELLERYSTTVWQRPIADHTRDAFRELKKFLNTNRPLILDSACGVGMSTCKLALQNPDHFVIGVEKSGARLQKFPSHKKALEEQCGHSLDNLCVIRADLQDMWRLLLREEVPIERNYILYPNPYPKKSQLGRRWHGHPVFPELFRLCPRVELRTNWDIYAREFASSWTYMAGSNHRVQELKEPEGLTPFEIKYDSSGQKIWLFRSFSPDSDLSPAEGF